jgi:ArsR family transcriptional regulator, arsenate/arsenite/antimonite-responsive transcriptional repressor
METAMLDRESAEAYASWFACLADATRLRLLHLLATAARPMTIGELVSEMDVGQSTVSSHVRRLADLEFVFVERLGTATYVRVNDACLTDFPAAADVVMGRLPVTSGDDRSGPPWATGS